MAHTSLFQLLQQTVARASSSEDFSLSNADDADDGESERPPTSVALSRRRLLRCSALAAGALALAELIPTHPTPTSAPRIAVVGGGIAGLNAAYTLQKLGLTATVYEAKPYVGGRIQSREGLIVPGLVNDLGAAFINSDHRDLLALVAELGLELFDRRTLTETLPFPEVAFYFEGRTLKESELVEALTPLAAQIGRDGAQLVQDFDRYAPQFDALSVADYLDLHSDKIGRRYVRSLLEATIRTEYGVEAHESAALQLIYNLPGVRKRRAEPLTADELFLVKGGTGRIPQTLAARLQHPVKTGWRLQTIQSQDKGFCLSFNQGAIEADYVILALPFPALRRIDLQVELPTTLREFIRECGPGRNEKLFAGFTHRPWLQPKGFTGGAWSDLGYSGLWDDTQRQPEHHQGVLTFFLGGDELRCAEGDVADRGREMIGRTVPHLRELQGAAGDRYARTAWAKDPDFGGAYTTFRPGQYLKFKDFLYVESEDPLQQQTVAVGNLAFAGEQFSDEYYGYMNGAAQTGRLAAAAVYAAIANQSNPSINPQTNSQIQAGQDSRSVALA
ncbi:FAD-dependent oxidoreductase [Nodosilinea sp. LEGE 06152]|uniref:flavin monoamine oxidase family protein n=1 Tax=Nodosilinea sp. LEGE 06152 TaxID=2777966 RepID=UPI001882BB15|nr:NAD(P)/FAD-dependent oxidoreductase [Nodosilinea sp. LEGE 06152]MBE9157516.1 FAD-dependent oxidoreductase [Nodosilinea sp. LEGE 06152]